MEATQREIMKVLVRTAARTPKKEMRERKERTREMRCSEIGHGVIERGTALEKWERCRGHEEDRKDAAPEKREGDKSFARKANGGKKGKLH